MRKRLFKPEGLMNWVIVNYATSEVSGQDMNSFGDRLKAACRNIGALLMS